MKIIKYIFFLTYYLSLITNLPAQPVQQEWVARYTGPGNDLYGPFLALDRFGNSYVAGTHVVNDSINILCVKYNTSGVQQWATLYKYPGEGYFAPSGLALDTSGNAYVTSIYGQTIFDPQNSLTVKFNGLNGSVLWAKKYIGQYGWSQPLDIKIDRLNNIYVIGWSDTSHLCIKYNTNGDSIWVRKYNPPGIRDLGYACTIDDSQNVIITGRRRYCPSLCFDTMLTVKYSTNGILRWIRTYRYDNLVNFGRKIVTDQFGNIYLAAVSRIPPYYIYVTVKYDRNGVQQWESIYNGPGWDDNIRSIAVDKIHGAVYVTGSSGLNGGTVYTATIKYNASNGDSMWVQRYGMTDYVSGAWDIKIDSLGNSYITGGSGPYNSTGDAITIKYSEQGSQIWVVTYNGPYGADAGFSLGLDNLNNIYVGGVSQSSFEVTDYIVLKYSQLSAIQPVSNEIPALFKLEQNYPNPFNSSTKFEIQSPKMAFTKVILYDILGREAKILVNERLKPGNYEVTFDATNYSSGVYFYRFIADGNIIDTKKLVIAK